MNKKKLSFNCLGTWGKWLKDQKGLQHVITSRTLDEEKRGLSYHVYLQDLESTNGLDRTEKKMLKDL